MVVNIGKFSLCSLCSLWSKFSPLLVLDTKIIWWLLGLVVAVMATIAYGNVTFHKAKNEWIRIWRRRIPPISSFFGLQWWPWEGVLTDCSVTYVTISVVFILWLVIRHASIIDCGHCIITHMWNKGIITYITRGVELWANNRWVASRYCGHQFKHREVKWTWE